MPVRPVACVVALTCTTPVKWRPQTRVIDQDERQVRREIDAFLSGRGADAAVVVYLLCHGLLDGRNRLYFAAADTGKTQPTSTGIASSKHLWGSRTRPPDLTCAFTRLARIC